ncbi:MAG TPA: sialidase family protein [Ramlibacter sp.]|nr:sialidase family protein [Ramlibacter sp.]
MDSRRRALLLGLMAAGTAAYVPPLLAGPAPALQWQGSVEVARGRGLRGPWQQNESRYDFVDDPSVALDDAGEAAIAWVDQARKAVLFQRYSAEGKPLLAQPVDVSRQPRTFSWLPRVALAPGLPRRVWVLWQEIIFSGGSHGGEMFMARSQDGGKSFAAPVNLSRSVGGDGKGRVNREVWHNGSHDLVAGPGGVAYAAWTEYEGPLWLSRSVEGGAAFSRPVRIAGEQAPARAPSLAVGADAALYLAWTLGDDDAADIHVARSMDGGQSFAAPVRVAASPGYSDAPRIAVDAQGVLHLVYAESSAGPFGSYRVFYTRSRDGGLGFEAPQAISDRLPPGFTSAAFPELALDARGRVFVLFELFRTPREPSLGLALAISGDRGRSFSPAVMVPGSVDPGGGFNGSSQGLLMRKLAVNASSHVAIVNSSLKQGSHSRVWLLRGSLPR